MSGPADDEGGERERSSEQANSKEMREGMFEEENHVPAAQLRIPGGSVRAVVYILAWPASLHTEFTYTMHVHSPTFI